MVGININNKLNFDIHAGINGQKTYRNLNALRKITNSMELPRNCILMNAFLYCTMNSLLLLCYLDVFLFHGRSLNNKINGIFKQCHRIIHNDEISNFKELLNKSNCF